MLAMVLHGMQGTPYIYQGEEIGMTNPNFTSIDQYRDVESLNMFAELSAAERDPDELLAILATKSRDNSRTPMQWDRSRNAGFSLGTPWIDPCSNYGEINVDAALADADSVFYAYQYLIALRKQHDVFTFGNYQDLCPQHPDLWCYLRHWQGKQLLVVSNLSGEPQQWQPEGIDLDGNWQLLMSSYVESAFQPQEMVLREYEGIYWLRD
jgi:trehalose-6-phosphate hydrolase